MSMADKTQAEMISEAFDGSVRGDTRAERERMQELSELLGYQPQPGLENDGNVQGVPNRNTGRNLDRNEGA